MNPFKSDMAKRYTPKENKQEADRKIEEKKHMPAPYW
jgi:hypothetical protein